LHLLVAAIVSATPLTIFLPNEDILPIVGSHQRGSGPEVKTG